MLSMNCSGIPSRQNMHYAQIRTSFPIRISSATVAVAVRHGTRVTVGDASVGASPSRGEGSASGTVLALY